MPVHIILPLRCAQVSKCTGRIRLWIQAGHCMALVDNQSEPLIRNIFDDSEMVQPNSEEEKDDGVEEDKVEMIS